MLGFLTGEVGVAVWVKQDGFGSEELAASVDLDRAAFEDHAAFENRKAEGGGDALRDGVVEIPGAEFSAPCVEFPVGNGHLACGIFH